jgi:hypothetical protein
MNKFKYLLFVIVLVILTTPVLKAYAPMGRGFGLGVMIGEPTGLTAKIWTGGDVAWALSIGNSYLGSLRIGADYLWHFNAFNSNVINMYAGPGIAVGIGESSGWWYSSREKTWYKQPNDIGVGIRGLFGINIVPRNTPIEFFGEVGLMVGVLPATHSNIEAALGVRFYFR